jgi:hypothetical protein
MAAENQHYVPKFILRQFMIDDAKEQVRVYDKINDTEFTTSIKNIMAERRFNEFHFDEYIASFEGLAGKIEDVLLPIYRTVLEKESLDHTPDQQAALAYFVTFQFVRTKAHRDIWQQIDDGLRQKIESMGAKIEDIQGYELPSENNLKKHHLLTLQETMSEFAPIVAAKNFMLLKAPENRSFYLGDTPVVMHNQQDFGFYGNIGLAVEGIEIYLPLSSRFVLCAYCPSIAKNMRDEWEDGKKGRQIELVKAVSSGQLSIVDVARVRQQMRPMDDYAELMIKKFETSGTIDAKDEQVDFINSLQTMHATRFVICKKGDLRLAQQHNAEFPKFRSGLKIVIN